MLKDSRVRAGRRVPLCITVSVEDYEYAESVLASADPKARDDFFMAAIDALRRQVDATRQFLERNGLYGVEPLPPLQYDVVVKLSAH